MINGDAEEWDTAEIVDYEDGNSSASGGSVSLNDVDDTESWINDEFDAKEMPLTDDREDADNENEGDPLIEEYKSVSFEIHRAKLRLRKLDRKMTLASRSGESQSDLVKEHSDFKIKIAALISQRRSLESHDVVRQHIKSEEDEEDENEVCFSCTFLADIWCRNLVFGMFPECAWNPMF